MSNVSLNERLGVDATVQLCKRVGVASLLLAGVFEFALLSDNARVLESANCALPPLLALICVFGSYRLIRIHQLLLLTPVPWFLLACAAYFGVGPSVYHLGNQTTIDLANAFFDVDEVMLTRTNLLNTVAIGTILLVFAFSYRRVKTPEIPHVYDIDLDATKKLIALLLIIGLPVKYFLTLPSAFHMIENVPGSVQQLSISTSLVLFILSYLIARKDLKFNFWISLFFFSEVFVSLLTFSKMESLLTILMIALGYFVAKLRFRSLVITGVIAIGFFVYMTPLVLRMREQLSTGSTQLQGYESRVALLSAYIFGGASVPSVQEESGEKAQIWWFRLDYANAQAFAIDQYDSGEPGDSFNTIVYSLVPRFLWPAKPAIAVGAKFNEHASSFTPISSTASLASASVDCGLPVSVTSLIRNRFTASSSSINSSVSPLDEIASSTSPAVSTPRSPWSASLAWRK